MSRDGNGIVDAAGSQQNESAGIDGEGEILIFGFLCVLLIMLAYSYYERQEAQQQNPAPSTRDSEHEAPPASPE